MYNYTELHVSAQDDVGQGLSHGPAPSLEKNLGRVW